MCLSNERQINLSFRFCLEQCNGQFDDPLLNEWYTNETGRSTSPWICVSAPVGREPSAYVEWDGITFGTVRSAWVWTNWPSRGQSRAGSYALNNYLIDRATHYSGLLPNIFTRGDFLRESQIQRPVSTPLLADGRLDSLTPLPADTPPVNLVTGDNSHSNVSGMRVVSIPRHGSNPKPTPSSWPQNRPLPGAVNVAFYDGHGESVKLDRLWQLYWSVDWRPPSRRPGLP